MEAAEPDGHAAQVESGKVAGRGAVVVGGEPLPLLDLVDAAIHGVAVMVERGVVVDAPSAPGAPSSWGVSAAWPGVSTKDSGRQRRSADGCMHLAGQSAARAAQVGGAEPVRAPPMFLILS